MTLDYLLFFSLTKLTIHSTEKNHQRKNKRVLNMSGQVWSKNGEFDTWLMKCKNTWLKETV